ncbi:unnamed protein product [Closterium sp. NIES-53]
MAPVQPSLGPPRVEPRVFGLDKFNGDNFAEWSFKMENIFDRYDLLEVMEGTEMRLKNDPEKSPWVRKSAQGYLLLGQALRSSQIHYIKPFQREPEKGPKAWATLKDVHAPSTAAVAVVLERQMAALRIEENEAVEEGVQKFFDLLTRLEGDDLNYSELQKKTKLLALLLDSWSSLIINPNRDLPRLSLEDVKRAILQEDFRRRQEGRGVGGGRGRGREGRGGRGGGAASMKSAGDESESKDNRFSGQFFFVSTQASAGPEKDEGFEEPAAVGKVTIHSHDYWVIDSGATYSMTPRADLLTELEPSPVKHVTSALGQQAEVKGMSKAMFKRADGKMVGLKNVLWVPNLAANLISVRRLQKAGMDTSSKGAKTYTARLGERIRWDLHEDRDVYNEMWQIPVVPMPKERQVAASISTKVTSKLGEHEESGAAAKKQHKDEENPKAAAEEYGENMWGTIASAAFSNPTSATEECDWLTLHRRMGHVAMPILQQLVKNEMVAGICVKGEPDEVLGCPTCMQAKFTRYPFSSSEATAKAPLDEVVMDVVGPLKLGAAGAEYFLTILEVYTQMTWVYVLSKKINVAETLSSSSTTTRQSSLVNGGEEAKDAEEEEEEVQQVSERAPTLLSRTTSAPRIRVTPQQRHESLHVPAREEKGRGKRRIQAPIRLTYDALERPAKSTLARAALMVGDDEESDYDECAFLFFSPVEMLGEPATLKEALEISDAEDWKKAMESKLKSIEENGTWELVELSQGRKAITSKWLFKIKSNADDKIEHYKSRLAAKGYHQKEKVDYKELFAPVCVKGTEEESVGEEERRRFHSLVGSLMYAAVNTRQDVAFANGQLARVVQCPNEEKVAARMRVAKYLGQTPTVGLQYSAAAQRRQKGADRVEPERLFLTAFSDASFASEPEDMTGVGGFICCVGGGPIAWERKKQMNQALSSLESKYMELFHAVREIVWQRRLLAELGEEQQGPTPLYCDSQGVIALAKNLVLHGLTKHMRVKWHWAKSMVVAGEFELHYVKTTRQPADMMTKRLVEQQHWKCCKLAGMALN